VAVRTALIIRAMAALAAGLTAGRPHQAGVGAAAFHRARTGCGRRYGRAGTAFLSAVPAWP